MKWRKFPEEKPKDGDWVIVEIHHGCCNEKYITRMVCVFNKSRDCFWYSDIGSNEIIEVGKQEERDFYWFLIPDNPYKKNEIEDASRNADTP